MGYGRGKVGSVVLARSKGQQVARAYNEAPKNPRSRGQMMQRSIFASAVKFYTRGRQQFFQFAFENKPATQSDYNAFMSENAKLGLHMSKAAFDEPTYPSIAPWVMTKGSLGQVTPTYNADSANFEIALPGVTSTSKWGDVSQAFINNFGFNGGDIVTICLIGCNGSDSSNTPSVEPSKRGLVSWTIVQAKLDVSSTEDVSDVLSNDFDVASGKLIMLNMGYSEIASGMSLTVSRNTVSGLKVSNSQLVLNSVAETVYAAGKQQGYIDDVLTSWKTSGEAILQGSLVN